MTPDLRSAIERGRAALESAPASPLELVPVADNGTSTPAQRVAEQLDMLDDNLRLLLERLENGSFEPEAMRAMLDRLGTFLREAGDKLAISASDEVTRQLAEVAGIYRGVIDDLLSALPHSA